MKITKQRLKEIIAEELEGSKNEGIFDFFRKKKKEEPKAEPEPEAPSEEELKEKAIGLIEDEIYIGSSRKYLDYFLDLRKIRGAFTGDRMKHGHLYAEDVADELGKMLTSQIESNITRAFAKAIYNVRKNPDKEFIEGVMETLLKAAKDRYEYMVRPIGNYNPSSKKSDFERWQSDDEGYDYMTRMEEGKITRRDLKALIAEELSAAEKERKAELEKELDTLKHK
tara:strand:+ start:89 stop:763 length:675 start_codon:yes stop_codon:yes gene_type:complete